MSTHTTKLVQVPLAIPAPLKAWLDVSAAAHGMSRNAYLRFLLQLARQDQEQRALKVANVRARLLATP